MEKTDSIKSACSEQSSIKLLPESSTAKMMSAYRIRILLFVCLFGIPIGLICGTASVLAVWKPFYNNWRDYSVGGGTTLCGPQSGSLDTLFAPDVTFGNFTISQARAIDLGSNLIMGRGLQTLITFVSYRIVTGELLRIAEAIPITFNVFVAVVFNGNTFYAIRPLLRAVGSASGFRFKATFTFMLLSAIFILALPTLMDISTGYVQIIEGYINLPNGTQFPGTRISDRNCHWLKTGSIECAHWTVVPNVQTPDCQYFSLANQRCYSTDEKHLEKIQITLPKRSLECVLSIERYQWGFSRAWLLALSSLFLMWGIGICGIWVDTSYHSEFHRKGIDLGKWKAIVDVGKAMQRELGHHLSEYSDTDLDRHMSLAAPVKYTTEQDEEWGQERIKLSSNPSEQLRLSKHSPNAITDGSISSLPQRCMKARLFQLLLALAEINLLAFIVLFNVSGFLQPWVYSIVSSVFTVTISTYGIAAGRFSVIHFVWAGISLDIITISIRVHSVVMEIGMIIGGPLDEKMPVSALLALSTIELILFAYTLVVSSLELHRFHKTCGLHSQRNHNETSLGKDPDLDTSFVERGKAGPGNVSEHGANSIASNDSIPQHRQDCVNSLIGSRKF